MSGKIDVWRAAAVAAGFVIAAGAALTGISVPGRLVVILVALTLVGLAARALFQDFQRAKKQRDRQYARAAQEKRDQAAVEARQERIETLGAKNAALVESVESAVDRVVASEAACAGWLGDVDFSADIAAIVETLQKAHALRKVADQLSALHQPTAADRKILAEAQATVAGLERKATAHIALIHRCAAEAELVDGSLRQERLDARNAEQRAELHARLSSMLYGIEATPDASSVNSLADAVIARVEAYREIRGQVQDFR